MTQHTLASVDAPATLSLSLDDVQRLLLGGHAGVAFGLDDTGRITWLNAAGARLLGYQPEELTGKDVAGTLIARDALAERATQLSNELGDATLEADGRLLGAKLVRGAASDEHDWTLRHKDGSPQLTRLCVGPLRDPSGRIAGFIAVEPVRQAGEGGPVRLAHHDNLTGLPNRAVLTDRAEMALQRAVRQNSVLAILLIEIVGFDALCEERGRSVGDDVLRATASRLHFELRKTDTAVRLDNGQFAAMLVDLHHADEALAIARKIRKSLSAKVNVGVGILPLTLRVGVAWYPEHADQLLPLLQAAESALETVTESGDDVTPAAAGAG